VRVSAKAVYSKFNIEPVSPINFGAMMKGTRKTQTIVLENKGMLMFKFCIFQASKDTSALPRLQPLLELFLQAQLNLGMFTVYPCSGSIAPWGQQKITVECITGPSQEGLCEEQFYLDITGR
ncbi:HYDIN protein, partial [Malurus elegans]|nr:HYDIN protein [Malurus elegans]